MLEIMFELPDREPGQTYLLNEKVVLGQESLFAQAAA